MEKDDTYRSQFRLPHSLYLLLKESADRNRRNLNAELIFRLDLALNEERLERHLSQQGMTRKEFDANEKAVARAFPAEVSENMPVEPRAKDDLDEEIKKLNYRQRNALLSLIRSMTT